MRDIDLQSVPGCHQELQDCANGMAYLDHLFGRVMDDLDRTRETWEAVEADAVREVRERVTKAATAVEVRGAVNDWIVNRADARDAREAYREAHRRKEKIERWMKTLEKRLSAAQTAHNGQLALRAGEDAPGPNRPLRAA